MGTFHSIGVKLLRRHAELAGPCGSIILCSDMPPGTKPCGLAS